MPRTPYAVEADLLLGEVRLPAAISKSDYLNKAADEIDLRIGRIYVTPVDLGNTDLTDRAKLILRTINAHLATGRIIMAMAVFTQDKSLHAYGKYMVDEALRQLSELEYDPNALEGAPVLDVAEIDMSGPSIAQQDETSPLDEFYGRFTGVGLTGPRTGWQPGDMS